MTEYDQAPQLVLFGKTTQQCFAEIEGHCNLLASEILRLNNVVKELHDKVERLERR